MPPRSKSKRARKPSAKAAEEARARAAAVAEEVGQSRRTVAFAEGPSLVETPPSSTVATEVLVVEPPVSNLAPPINPTPVNPTPVNPTPVNPTPVNTAPPLPPVDALASDPPVVEPPAFDVDLRYTIRINGDRRVQDGEVSSFLFLMPDTIEQKVEELIASPMAGVDGRELQITNREASFRVSTGRGSAWRHHTLKDFSNSELFRLLNRVEQLGSGYKNKLIELRIEVSVEVPDLRKAFRRNRSFNEPSSEPPVTVAPSRSTRTTQLLAERRTSDRVEALQTASEWQSQITRMWECREEDCSNYKRWCYVHQATHAHYEIRPVDCEGWAKAIFEGTTGVSVSMPPLHMLEYWRQYCGDQLKKGRDGKKKKKKRRSSSSSSDDLKALQKQAEKRRIQERIEQMEEEQMMRRERRELQRLQMDQQFNALGGYMGRAVGVAPSRAAQTALPPPVWPSSSIPARPVTPVGVGVGVESSHAGKPAPSSPIIAGVEEDPRALVREFFDWLIAEQPDEDQVDFKQAAQVALNQKWTVEDLRAMSSPSSSLYKVALSHELKDGVVRHLRKDLRRFKKQYRGI